MKKEITKKLVLASSLALALLIDGCGGGVSGTGGIAGDIVSERKVSDLNDKERTDICSRIASEGTNGIKNNRFILSFNVGMAIFNRYREPSTFSQTPNANGYFDEHIGALKPNFASATSESVSNECQAEYDRVVAFQGAKAQCLDAGVPHPEIGYTASPEELQKLGIFGTCDLQDPVFEQKGTSVGALASCLEEYFKIQVDGAVFELNCDTLYDAIKTGDRQQIQVKSTNPNFDSQDKAIEAWKQRCDSTIANLGSDNSIVPLVCNGMGLDDQYKDESLQVLNGLIFFSGQN